MITDSYKTVSFIIVFASLAILSACDFTDPILVYEESNLNRERMYLVNGSHSEEYRLNDFNDEAVHNISSHYDRYGSGAVDVRVSFNPSSSTNTAMSAGKILSDVALKLRKNGIREQNADLIPIKTEEPMVLISYDTVSLKAPDNCSDSPGWDRDIGEGWDDYRLGCQLETLLSKQIARPKDIENLYEIDPTSASRTYGRNATYHYGEDLPELSDWNASDVGE